MSNTSSSAPVALVVGAGDYIGSEISKRFSAGGYQVCMGRRNAEKLEPLAEEIRSAGGLAHPFSFDARSEERTEEVFAEIEREVGALEVVVYNPGANVNFPIRDTTARVFRKVWEMACFGGFLTGREAAKYMAPREKGSIFFTGATASLRGGSGFGAFASAKFGLRALAQSMARELMPQGIHVAHVPIDAAIGWTQEDGTRRHRLVGATVDDNMADPLHIAETYLHLHRQHRSTWTFEAVLRPWVENW